MAQIDSPPATLDITHLERWLNGEIPGPARSVAITTVRGGSSNAMYKVVRDGRSFALRTPPATLNDRTSNTLKREVRLLRALKQTRVPHAAIIAADETGEQAGQACIITEWIDGFAPGPTLPAPFHDDMAARHAVGMEMIAALAEIAKVDWKAIGLTDFGKPDGFLERQVDRWLSQWERYRTRDIPHLLEAAQWLRDRRPKSYRVGFIHGDFQPFNVLFHRSQPARLAVVLDWETATIGDPLLDLGHLLAGWREDGEGPGYLNDMVDWRGFASRAEVADRYSALTGYATDAITYYQVLALFRLAVILEGHYYRWKTGASTHPNHQRCEAKVLLMFRQAASLMEKG